ncbi:hypothetical protein [Thermococcus thioreducens]|uniref:Uncharacterized protein n=1 Tax=Thermococcus thioreducens TaxID=277988 RepID=A0A0Q2QSL6_9EURY|nr:hypothetical protein [Thermococcus thioreducens]ASJ12286.1 hypothetical protein A3L14_05000 [Thermococcus thioreducens]KQH83021.1 hypothetical protein AMR53_01995 [Thermococcus thioreducens]SEV93511.1 hypothetical protein SAMN05216170_0967 [Thermococcus thioreducens]
MRRYLFPVVVVLIVLGGILSTAYALSQPPSQRTLALALENTKRYQFSRSVEFKQYRVYIVHNGNSKNIRREFLYKGRTVTKGTVDLTKGVVTEYDELYINGSLVMKGEVVFDLNTGKISGTVTLANGTKMDILQFWERYYGINPEQAMAMMRANLPTLLLRDVALGSKNFQALKDSVSLTDRILMGLGLKEKLFEYRFTARNGAEWRVFVNSNGIPVRFEYDSEDAKVVVDVTPLD